MTQIRIGIIDLSGSRKLSIEVPNDVPVSVLCDAIVNAMELPTKGNDGDRIFYYLTVMNDKDENITVNPSATLEENNISVGDVLLIQTAKNDVLIKNQATIGLTQDAFSFQEKGIHLISSNLLRVSIPLPELISIWDYFASTIQTMQGIEFIYYVFAILSSKRKETIDQFLINLKNSVDLEHISVLDIYTTVKNAKVQPLQVVSSHYGSPASFDLLGVGKVLEIVREITTDLHWRGKHNSQMAQLERKSKELEIKKANIDTRKSSIEIEAEQVRLQKLKLENEKMMIEIASQKLDFIQRTSALELSDENRKVIISTLLPKMIMLSQVPQDLLEDT